MHDLTVVLPAHKEDPKIVTGIYNELLGLGCEVIVVDDGGDMVLDFPHLYHTPNMGYGYALKRGIAVASRPIVLTMDSDGQHTVEDVKRLYQVFKISECKMVIGQRWLNYEKPHRWLGRKGLNFIASLVTGHYLSDLNSGMRIFDADLARRYSEILCDTFSFTTSITIAFVTDKYRIMYCPINVQARKYGKSHVRVVKHGFITLYYILWIGIALRTRGLRAWIRKYL